MNVMLDFTWMRFTKLWAKWSKRKIQMKKYICLQRESIKRPLFFRRGAFNHSNTLIVNDMLQKLLCNFEISINTCGDACMILILVIWVLKLNVRQNLHFFYLCRCYLLLFTEHCMNKPIINFHTCIVISVDWYSKVV